MEIKAAVTALAALAQETRLSIYRLLVEAGPQGMAAGRIGEKLNVPGATLSFHLKELSRASLVSARQETQFIYYAVDFERMAELMGFAFVTRVTAGLNILFFVIGVAVEDTKLRKKISAICVLSFPVLVGLAALALYNHARFGNWLEQGYSLQVLDGAAARARSYGVMTNFHFI